MKIMHVNAFYTSLVGGATILSDSVCRRLSLENQVSVFAGEINNTKPTYAARAHIDCGIKVRIVNLSGLFAMNLDASIDSFNEKNYLNPMMGSIFREYLEESRPELVHFHSMQWLGANLIEEAKSFGVKIVLTMHDWWWVCGRQFLLQPDGRPCPHSVDPPDCFCKKEEGYGRRAEYLRGVLEKVDRILVPSHVLKDSLEKRGLAGLDIRVLENGINKPGSRVCKAPAREGVVFGYLGGENMLKGMETLRDAVLCVKGGPFTVNMYGFGLRRGLLGDFLSGRNVKGPARGIFLKVTGKFRSKAAVLHHRKVAGRFKFFPFFPHDQLDRIMCGLDVMIVPSLVRESYSLVTREALARGAPVIASDCGGPEEIIKDGVNGFIFKTGDASDLASKLERFITDGSLLRKMQDNIDPSSIKLIDEHVEELTGVYNELLSGRPARDYGADNPALCFDPNPPEYVEALEKYLYEKARGTSYEEPIRQAYLNYDRFFGWIGSLKPYLNLNGKRVLDSGCSVGGLMVALARTGAIPHGVEVSEDLYNMAKVRLGKFKGSEVVLLKSDKMPFEDEFFDAVFSIHVVEHVRDLDGYLTELLRVMKKDGVALVEFPNRFFPVEPHNHLYLLPYLPKKLANRICLFLAGTRLFGKDLTLRLTNAADDHQLANFLTRSDIKRHIESRVEILEESYPRERLLAEAGISSRYYSGLLKRIPWTLLGKFSWIFQRNITLIFRKN